MAAARAWAAAAAVGVGEVTARPLGPQAPLVWEFEGPLEWEW